MFFKTKLPYCIFILCIIINENKLTIIQNDRNYEKFVKEDACYYFDLVIKKYQKICDFKQVFRFILAYCDSESIYIFFGCL